MADAVGAAGRAGLDLAGVDGDGDIGNGGVLGLAGAVGDDRRVACAVGHLDSVEGLGQGADLVDLDEDCVGGAQLDALLEALDVGDEQVVADELDACGRGASVSSFQPSQSFSAMPSSMEMMGYLSTKPSHIVDHLLRWS